MIRDLRFLNEVICGHKSGCFWAAGRPMLAGWRAGGRPGEEISGEGTRGERNRRQHDVFCNLYLSVLWLQKFYFMSSNDGTEWIIPVAAAAIPLFHSSPFPRVLLNVLVLFLRTHLIIPLMHYTLFYWLTKKVVPHALRYFLIQRILVECAMRGRAKRKRKKWENGRTFSNKRCYWKYKME